MKQDHNLKQVFPEFTLANDIVNSQRIHPAIAVTRNSEATYFNQQGILVTAAPNIPVIEYDHLGNCLGLRLEAGVTNFIKDSEFRTIAATGTDVWKHEESTAVGASTMKAPDGVSDAVLLNPNKNNSGTLLYHCTTRNAFNAHHCFSFFIKKNTGNIFNAAIYTVGAEALVMVDFDLSDKGSIVGDVNYHKEAMVRDCRIEKVGSNDWFRVSLHVSVLNNDSVSTGVRMAITPSGVDSSFYLWGAQLEDHYDCTSHIKTNGREVTRAMTFVGLENENLLRYVDGDNFTIMTSIDLRTTSSSNHIVPGFSIFASSTRRARALMHVITMENYDTSRVMLSGRMDTSVTRNTQLIRPLTREQVQKFGKINFAITSTAASGIMAATMGKSVMANVESGNIGVDNSTKLTVGGYATDSNSRSIAATGENSITGYLRGIAISKSPVSREVLKAMTHQDVDMAKFAGATFYN